MLMYVASRVVSVLCFSKTLSTAEIVSAADHLSFDVPPLYVCYELLDTGNIATRKKCNFC